MDGMKYFVYDVMNFFRYTFLIRFCSIVGQELGNSSGKKLQFSRKGLDLVFRDKKLHTQRRSVNSLTGSQK